MAALLNNYPGAREFAFSVVNDPDSWTQTLSEVSIARRFPPIIGLTGAAGAGKDTVGDFLRAKYNYRKYALSSPIKRALNAVYGWAHTEWDDRVWKEAPQERLGGLSPRDLANSLGTDWGRDMVDPDIWLNPLIEMAVTEPLIVAVDIRFNNEATAVLALGGVIWRIEGRKGAEVTHKSAKGVADYWIDETIDNSGDRAELFHQIDALLLPHGTDA